MQSVHFDTADARTLQLVQDLNLKLHWHYRTLLDHDELLVMLSASVSDSTESHDAEFEPFEIGTGPVIREAKRYGSATT